MTWPLNLARMIRDDMREAARLRGAMSTYEQEASVAAPLRAQCIDVANRRIVGLRRQANA